MSAVDLIHFGDVVYFTAPVSGGQEEKVWTMTSIRPNTFQLVPKSEVVDPFFALFVLKVYNNPKNREEEKEKREEEKEKGEEAKKKRDEEQEKREEAKKKLEEEKERRGQKVKSGDNICLFHLLTQKFVSWEQTNTVREVTLAEISDLALTLSISAERTYMKTAIRNNDILPIQGKQGKISLILGHKFWFKGTTEDRWVIHRFEEFSENQKEVRYGQVYSLRASNSMYLSVRPNFDNSTTLLLDEQNQSSGCLKKTETLNFPEYLETLRADLSTESEDGNNLWVFEREDRFKSGFLKSDEFFYLRNIASNRYLASDLSLVSRSGAPIFTLKSVDGAGNIGFSEFADFINNARQAVSIDSKRTDDWLKAEMFMQVLSDLPKGTVMRHAVKVSAERLIEDKMKFQVNHVSTEMATAVLRLSEFVRPLAELRTILQNCRKLEGLEKALRSVDLRIDTNYLTFSDRSFAIRATLSSDLQFQFEMLRIYLLYNYYKADFGSWADHINIFKNIRNIMMLMQYFGRVFYAIWSRKQLIEKCFLTMPMETSDILGQGLLTNFPSERARLYWNDFCMTRKLAEKTQPNFFKICFFLQRLLDRIETPVPKTNLDIVKQDGNFVVQFFYDGRIRFFDEIKPVEELPPSTVTSLRYAVMLFPDLCLDPAMKSELIAGTGLSPQTAVQFYMKKLESWEMNVLLLHFIARVCVSDELNRVPISKILETRVLSWQQIAAVKEIDQKQWFYFPNIDSAFAQLIKDEVYYWLSTVHEINGDPADWYNLAGFHLRFIEKLIDYDAVSNIFVSSMMSAVSAMMMWVFKEKTEGFSERFPDISKSIYTITPNIQFLIETYLALVGVYQQWKMIKVMRKIALLEKVPQSEIQRAIQELTFESILQHFCSQFNSKKSSSSHRGESLLGSEELSPLIESLKKLQAQPFGKVETVLMFIFKNKEYRCKGRPETLLKLIDNEIDMSVHLTTYLQDSIDTVQYDEFRPIVEDIRKYPVSLIDLETESGDSVTNLQGLISAVEKLTDFMHELEPSFEDSKRFQTFLRKFNFHMDLKRLWEKCESIGSEYSEEENTERLRKLTITLTRLYIHRNLENNKQVFMILPIKVIYPDYPEYVLLTKKLFLINSEDEVAAKIAERAFNSITKSDSKRHILVIQELLRNTENASKVVFIIADCFEKLESDSLSPKQWEMLRMISRFLTPAVRMDLFESAIEKWYESSNDCIQKYIATIYILCANHTSERFTTAWEGLEVYILQLKEKSDQKFFDSCFQSISMMKAGNYTQREESSDEDALFLLNVICEDNTGLLSLISKDVPKAVSNSAMREISLLLFRIVRNPQHRTFAIALAEAVKGYYEPQQAELSEEDAEILKQVQAMEIPPKPSKNTTKNIEKPLPIIVVEEIKTEENKTEERPFLSKLFAEEQKDQQSSSQSLNNTQTSSSMKPITQDTFNDLKKWLLAKKIKSEFLLSCKYASERISDKNSNSFGQVIEDLLKLAVHEDNPEVTDTVLVILSTIMRKSKKKTTREFFLNFLKERMFYLQVFGIFSELIKRRNELVAKIGFLKEKEQRNRQKEIEKKPEHLEKKHEVKEIENQKITAAIIAFLSLFQSCCDGCDGCDGCNVPFQNFLRDQGEGLQNNISIITLATGLMTNALCDLSAESSHDMLQSCCLMLIKVISGPCVENQVEVCAFPMFVESIFTLVNREIAAKKADEKIKTVMSEVVGVILALLEGRERNLKEISKVIHLAYFDVFENWVRLQEEQFNDKTLTSISLETSSEELKTKFDFTIKCLLVCFNTLREEKLQEFRQMPMSKFVSLVEIEDVDQTSSKPRIRFFSFQVSPKFLFLTSRTALKLLFEIDRESRKVKLDDFTNKVKICEVEMQHQQALSRWKCIKVVTNWWKYYWYLSFLLVCLINVLLIMVVNTVESNRFNIEEQWLVILTPLTYAQIGFSLLGTVSYYIEYWYILKTSMKRNLNTTEMEKLPTQYGPGSSLMTNLSIQQPETSDRYDIDEVIKALIRIAYSVSACLAYWYPFIYPFLLFQIVNLNDSVVNILKSVSMRGSQLLLTFLFALITIYAFTLIAYFYLYEYYDHGEGLYCSTLADCLLSTLNLGMRSGGGIGDALGPPEESTYGLRVTFDLLFFICITTVLMAIVFGLIVDTFSELRDERNANEFDTNNICLICGKSRSVIELKGEGWEKHTQFVHNPFAYLYFLIYVKEKNLLDCSGVEKIVKKKLEKKDISFYPSTSRKLGFDIGY